MQAKIWNYQAWIKETRPYILSNFFENALEESAFRILGQQEYYFHPYGYTKLFLLGESHLAIHTFPEEQKTYVELSSCNFEKYQTFLKIIQESEIL